jgi:hypothetical protein
MCISSGRAYAFLRQSADYTVLTYPKSTPRNWTAVDMLKGPLEADVQEASEACWTMDSRLVQVGGFPLAW